LGQNKLRENLTLSHIFQILNSKSDNILSLDEILDMASKVDIYITQDEASKLLSLMDVNGDDLVDEADFIAFMKRYNLFN
jgi:Ca2+-binding EF-hand superfamily protein